MNVTTRLFVAIFAVLAIILTATAISSVKHSQELNAQLEQAQAELQQLKSPATTGTPTSGNSAMLQKLLAEETAANARLRKDIARLKNRPIPATVTNVTTVVAEVATNAQAGGRNGGRALMERMRQEDPEGYKQMVADREQRRKEADNWYDNTQGQLAARAQAAASPEEADLATQIATTLSKLSDLRQQMQALRELPADQQQVQMAELIPEWQSTMQQMNQLREQDRTLQYQQLATQLGLTGEKAQTLATSIPEILKNTQYTPPGGGGGQRGGGFGGFGFGGFGGPPPTTPAK